MRKLARGSQGTGEGIRCGAGVPSHQQKGKDSMGSGGFAGSVTGARGNSCRGFDFYWSRREGALFTNGGDGGAVRGQRYEESGEDYKEITLSKVFEIFLNLSPDEFH